MPPISDLESRVVSLAERFLDAQIAQEADATFDPCLDDIAAFRLLVHAEIEDWLERCASEQLSKLALANAIPTSLRKSLQLIYLASLFEVQIPLALPFNSSDFQVSVAETLNRARQFVKDNNGIKAGSFCKVAMICGACLDEVDGELVQALNSYGTARGMVAHKSSQRVTSLLAPSAEKNDAINLVEMLKVFFGMLQPI
jgi:hypothetical protein